MPEIVKTTVYQIHELDAGAKDVARAWYRSVAFVDDWHEFVIEDFCAICAILGVDLKTRAVRLMGGGTLQEPCVWFSGFWSQGDGACFEGRYTHRRGAAKTIRRYVPQDGELHRIADALQATQARNFYQLAARIRHHGRYSHEYSMAIDVERNSPNVRAISADAENALIEALRDLARWLYRQLEREYLFQSSDESVDEAIAANGYSFTQIGRRF